MDPEDKNNTKMPPRTARENSEEHSPESNIEPQEKLPRADKINQLRDQNALDKLDHAEDKIPDNNAPHLLPTEVGRLQKLKRHSRTLLLGMLGSLCAAAVPLWQIYFVETSDVNIEIASIGRVESDSFMVFLETAELLLLEPYIPELLLYEYDSLGVRGDKIDYPSFSMDTLFSAYEKAKRDLKNISTTKASLQKNIKRIDAFLDPNNKINLLTEFRVSDLKEWDLSNYIDDSEAHYYEEQVLKITRSYSSMLFSGALEPKINIQSLSYLLTDVREDINDVIATSNVRLELLRDNIRSIETQLEKLKAEQLRNYTLFTIEVIASNSGRVSTSLRPLALMRVQISENNYVDIRLQMDNYREQAGLMPLSTNILHYRSTELNTFPSEDRSLINNFWGSTGRVRLFTLDTKHNVFTSNQIAFVDSRNQKLMTDHLKEAASKNMH